MATTTEYQVTGMSCGHGVTAIDVSAATGRLAVTSETLIDDAAVLAAVDEAGFTAVRS